MKSEEYQRAQELYLASQGHISYAELARQVGVSKKTVNQWSQKHQWRQKVAELEAAISQKVTEKIVETVSQRAAALAESSLEPLARISALVGKRLEDPVLDTEQLRPADLRSLALAADSVIKKVRLMSGQTTANEGRELSGKVSIEIDGFLDQKIQQIVRDGDINGQLMLAEIQHSIQRLIEG